MVFRNSLGCKRVIPRSKEYHGRLGGARVNEFRILKNKNLELLRLKCCHSTDAGDALEFAFDLLGRSRSFEHRREGESWFPITIRRNESKHKA